jgi:D-glycero-D-manno-heptose 1,7-bisphosphate phosphatase
MQQVKLVILGRDGILNVFRPDHVKSPEEWEPIPGALEAVARLNHAGWHVVIATNQSGIGRGLIDMTTVNAIHQQMMKLLAEKGGRIDAVFFCPHAPNEQCNCRKPLPGLIQQIGERYGVGLDEVPMAGDTLRDLQAAHAAGCPPHLVRTGRASALDDAQLQDWLRQVPGTQVHDDLDAFVRALMWHPQAPGASASAPAPTAAAQAITIMPSRAPAPASTPRR